MKDNILSKIRQEGEKMHSLTESDLSIQLERWRQELTDLNNSIAQMTKTFPKDKESAGPTFVQHKTQQREADEDLKIGNYIVWNAYKAEYEVFPDLAKGLFGYDKAPDHLAQELGPKVLQAKENMMLGGQEKINETNARNLYTNLLNIMRADYKEKDKSSRRNFVIGSQAFQLNADPEKIPSECPQVILEFKRDRHEQFEKKGFESPFHEMATYLVKCLSKYGYMNPPKYLVGIVLDGNGAEMLIIDTKLVMRKKISECSASLISFKWDCGRIIKLIQKNQEKDKEIEETYENVSFEKRNKFIDLDVIRFEYFFLLFDFILYLLK